MLTRDVLAYDTAVKANCLLSETDGRAWELLHAAYSQVKRPIRARVHGTVLVR